MKKLKILFLTGEIYPDAWGGADIHLFELCKNLSKRGHEVTILTGKEKEKDKNRERVENFNIERYSWKNHGNLLLNRQSKGLALKKAFQKKIGRENFDLVHINSPIAWKAVSDFDELPLFQTFHAPLFEEEMIEAEKAKHSIANPKKYLKKIWLPLSLKELRSAEKKCYHSVNQIFVLSEYMKKKLMNYFDINPGKIKIIPGGVDVNKFKPGSQEKARQRLGLPRNKKIIICSRRLVARMGLENLVDAFKIISEKMPDSLLVITGDGYLRKRLENQAKDLGLEKKVIFTGFIEDKILPTYFQAANLFVLPTEKLEGFGLATIEALSTGLPVLGTPVGGTKEILGKLDNRLLFRGVSSNIMAKQIIDFLKKDHYKLKARYREFASENYGWPEIVKQFEEQYLKMVKK